MTILAHASVRVGLDLSAATAFRPRPSPVGLPGSAGSMLHYLVDLTPPPEIRRYE